MSEDKTRICGYCVTGTHELCRPEIKWYDKVWYCYCKTCNTQEKEETNTNGKPIEETVRIEELGEQDEPETRQEPDRNQPEGI